MAECYNLACPYCVDYKCKRTATCDMRLDGEYVKVKHGHWVWNKRLGEWYCSNCDRIMNPYTVEKSEGLYEMAQPFYCGWCGAKMDGGENG